MSEPTLIQKLQAAQEAIAALTTERDTLKADLETAGTLAAGLQAAQVEADLKAQADKAEAGKLITETAAKLEAEAAARKEAEQAKQSAEDELAKAKRALSNPAFADAAITGAKPVADSGKPEEKSMALADFRKLSPIQQADLSARRITLT